MNQSKKRRRHSITGTHKWQPCISHVLILAKVVTKPVTPIALPSITSATNVATKDTGGRSADHLRIHQPRNDPREHLTKVITNRALTRRATGGLISRRPAPTSSMLDFDQCPFDYYQMLHGASYYYQRQ